MAIAMIGIPRTARVAFSHLRVDPPRAVVMADPPLRGERIPSRSRDAVKDASLRRTDADAETRAGPPGSWWRSTKPSSVASSQTGRRGLDARVRGSDHRSGGLPPG